MKFARLLVLACVAMALSSVGFTAVSYTFEQKQQIQQATPALNNFFGWSMKMDKSSTYLAIGAPLTSYSGTNNFYGEVNVFQRTPAGPITNATLTWSPSGTTNYLRNSIDRQSYDFFGQELFVGYDNTGSGSTNGQVVVAVYALRGISTELRQGGVYLFTRTHSDTPSANSWSNSGSFANVDSGAGTAGKLKPINYGNSTLAPFRFGESLAGDVSRSGGRPPILIVGEFRYSKKQGRVHIYQYTGGNWMFNKTMYAPPSYQSQNAGFGIAIAIHNDYLAISSSGVDLNRGAVHVYKDIATAPASAFSLLKSVRSLDGVVGDQYGWSVALNDDWLIIGANRREDCGVACGAVYANYRDTGITPFVTEVDGWGQKVKLDPGFATPGSQIGFSVAITGGFVVAGAPDTAMDNITVSSGGIFVFQQNTGPDGFYKEDAWGLVGKFSKATPVARDRLGRQVATHAPHVLASAMLDDTTSSNAGSAYYWLSNLPLGGTTGNPMVNPNVTLTNVTTSTTSTTTSGSGTSTLISAGPASTLESLLFVL